MHTFEGGFAQTAYPVVCGGQDVDGIIAECYIVGEWEPAAILTQSIQESSSVILDDGRLWVTGLLNIIELIKMTKYST